LKTNLTSRKPRSKNTGKTFNKIREDLDYLVGLKRKMKDDELNGRYNDNDDINRKIRQMNEVFF
jgi:hypothetical protein